MSYVDKGVLPLFLLFHDVAFCSIHSIHSLRSINVHCFIEWETFIMNE